MAHSLLTHGLPALVLGGALGFWGASWSERGETTSRSRSGAAKAPASARSRFLSSDNEAVDYDRLAKVCLAAAGRSVAARPATGALLPGADLGPSVSELAPPDPQVVRNAKRMLDDAVAASLQVGSWSRAAGFRARASLKKLPPSDVADFQALLRSMMDAGDLKAVPGAWVPWESH